ncbi:MAG: hypothetical protein SX243_22525 [Acidobacteriota bacterium]|nr:hypothetical protein [Acidobacteriota bacterium]
MKTYLRMVAIALSIVVAAPLLSQPPLPASDLAKYCADLAPQTQEQRRMIALCREAFDVELEVGDGSGADLSKASNAVIEVGNDGEKATLQLSRAWIGSKLTATATASVNKDSGQAEFVGFADQVGAQKLGLEYNYILWPVLDLYRLHDTRLPSDASGYAELLQIQHQRLYDCRSALHRVREVRSDEIGEGTWSTQAEAAFRSTQSLELPSVQEIDQYMKWTSDPDRLPDQAPGYDPEVAARVQALNKIADERTAPCGTSTDIALSLITADLIDRGLLTEKRTAPLFGLNASVGRTEFTFLDRDLLTTTSEFGKTSDNEYPTSLGVRFGVLFLADGIRRQTESSLVLSYSRERGYEAAKNITFCEPVDDFEDFSALADCQDIARGAPSGVESDLLTLEYRRKFGKAGLALRGFHRTKSGQPNDFGFEVPIYFIPNKDGNFQGGLTFGWSDQADNVTLAVFVGRKFEIFE